MKQKRLRKTQIESYKETLKTVSDRQKSVLGALTVAGSATNRELAKLLGWDINRVTGRITELVNLGMVNTNGTKKDLETNRTVTLWTISQ
tara:strand:+ start:107 stop:376 length:270 start_codon:yes stop_codon:yes gene_type:complete